MQRQWKDKSWSLPLWLCRNRMVCGTPEGLKTTSMAIIWHLFITIGLVLKPFQSYYGIIRCYIFYFIDNTKDVLAGYRQYSIMVNLRSLRIIRCICKLALVTVSHTTCSDCL